MTKKLISYILVSMLVVSMQLLSILESQAAMPFFEKENKKPTLAPLLNEAFPAVVSISIIAKKQEITNPLLNDPFFNHFFKDFSEFRPHNRPRSQKIQSIGSGVIINASKGYIVTNHHVIENAEEIFITLHNKRKIEATLVGFDEATDIAILKINEKNLVALPIGDSDKLEVGDFAVAIGNPFGLNHTVTSGIISGLSRSGLGIEGYEDFIQTDASINPGNSGGALINLDGELIGINTAILSRTGRNMGIGFAIPINMAQMITNQLIEHGKVKRGQIGIYTQNLTAELAKAMALDIEHGALISKVNKNSPAEKAGLKEGDVITKVDEKDIKNISAVKNVIGIKRVGDEVTVEFIRKKKKNSTKVKIVFPEDIEEDSNTIKISLLEGANFSNITSNHPLHGQIEGVEVTKVTQGSIAWKSGLNAGDIIVSVNDQRVRNLKELKQASSIKKNGILMQVRRKNAALYIVIH